METAPPWFTYDEIANMLFVRKRTVYNRVSENKIPRIHLRKDGHPLAVFDQESVRRIAEIIRGPLFASRFPGSRSRPTLPIPGSRRAERGLNVQV